MRGNLKSDEYFADLLSDEDEEISDLNELIDQARAEQGEDSDGVRNGYQFLQSSYLKQFDLIYTLGTQDERLPHSFAGLLRYTALACDPEADSYFDLVKVLSLAVLFGADPADPDLSALLGNLREAHIEDYLVDRLCGRLDPSWPYRCETFRWKKTFEPLKPVLESPDEHGIDEVRTLLQKRWLVIHRGCWWYGGHKSASVPYYGYWAYECAAVARMAELDDGSLQGERWYPYDLAHMKACLGE